MLLGLNETGYHCVGQMVAGKGQDGVQAAVNNPACGALVV
jgi:hypothetical protein